MLRLRELEDAADRAGFNIGGVILSKSAEVVFGAVLRLAEEDRALAAHLFVHQFAACEDVWLLRDAIRLLFDQRVIDVKDTRREGFWSRLPRVVTGYRGVSSGPKIDPRGISWTLSRAWADWYADRWGGGKPGQVVRAEIPRELIVLAHNYRGESEIVVPWWSRLPVEEVAVRPRRDLVNVANQRSLASIERSPIGGRG